MTGSRRCAGAEPDPCLQSAPNERDFVTPRDRPSRSRGFSGLGVRRWGVEGHRAGDLRHSGQVVTGTETGSVIALCLWAPDRP